MQSAAVYGIADHGSPNRVTLRFALNHVPIQIAETSFTAGHRSFAADTFLIPSTAADTLKPAVQ